MQLLRQIEHLIVQHVVGRPFILDYLRDEVDSLFQVLFWSLCHCFISFKSSQLHFVAVSASMRCLIHNSAVDESMCFFINLVDNASLIISESLIKQILLQCFPLAQTWLTWVSEHMSLRCLMWIYHPVISSLRLFTVNIEHLLVTGWIKLFVWAFPIKCNSIKNSHVLLNFLLITISAASCSQSHGVESLWLPVFELLSSLSVNCIESIRK